MQSISKPTKKRVATKKSGKNKAVVAKRLNDKKTT
jgi:hypothetical protein